MSDNIKPLHTDDIELWTSQWEVLQKEFSNESTKQDTSSFDFVNKTAFYYLNQDLGNYGSESATSEISERKIANPVYPDSIGVDSETPIADIDSSILDEMQKLKDKIHEIGNKIAAMNQKEGSVTEKPIDSDSAASLFAKLKEANKKLEDISSSYPDDGQFKPYNTGLQK